MSGQPRVITFFYGSYMNSDVLGEVDLAPERIEVARDGGIVLALCYIAHSMDAKPADDEYVDRIVTAARRYGFPAWYVRRLESFRAG